MCPLFNFFNYNGYFSLLEAPPFFFSRLSSIILPIFKFCFHQKHSEQSVCAACSALWLAVEVPLMAPLFPLWVWSVLVFETLFRNSFKLHSTERVVCFPEPVLCSQASFSSCSEEQRSLISHWALRWSQSPCFPRAFHDLPSLVPARCTQ